MQTYLMRRFLMRKHLFLGVFLFVAPIAKASVTEIQYNQVIAETNSRLAPFVLKKYSKVLLVTGDWEKQYSPTSAGGSFYIQNGKWGVHLVGWVARSPEVSPDGMRISFCHELGHHIYGGGGEVESDYFATSICAPLAFASTDPLEPQISPLSDSDRKACARASRPLFCERVMQAVVRVNDGFRARLWRQYGISEQEVTEMAGCRHRVFLSGLIGDPMPPCQR